MGKPAITKFRKAVSFYSFPSELRMLKKTPQVYYIADELRNLRVLAKSGVIEYDKAKKLAEPLLVRINEKMEKIAKKNNRFFRKVVFSNF